MRRGFFTMGRIILAIHMIRRDVLMTAKETVGRDRPLERMLLPWVGRLSEGVTRFLLAAALSGAEVMGGHALFGLALVGVCRPGGQGLAALLGAALGYLSFWGFVGGLR